MSVAVVTPHLVESTVRDLGYRAAELLDAEEWDAWLDLCAPGFTYAIVAYSPEIRRDMIWLEHDLAGIRNLVMLLPKHYSDLSRFTRHVSVYRAAPADDGSWNVLTSVAMYRTELDGGATSLFAIGKYSDVVVAAEDGRAAFARRTLRLETRALGMGTHYPL